MIRVGLIGCGLFATQKYLPLLLNEFKDSLDLVAAYSRGPESCSRVAERIKKELPAKEEEVACYHGTNGLRKLLERKDIEAVIIVVPIHIMFETVKLALQYSKHVLSEKPMSHNLVSARELLALYESSYKQSLVWLIAENYRMETCIHRASIVAQDMKAYNITLQSITGVPPTDQFLNTSWRGKDPTFQGGFLFDGGIHSVAALNLIVGSRCISVSCNLQEISQNMPGHPDTLSASLNYENGVSAILFITYGANPKSKNKFLLDCTGREGRFELERKARSDGNFGYVMEKFPSSTEDGKEGQIEEFGFEGIKNELQEFIKLVNRSKEDGGSIKIPASLLDASPISPARGFHDVEVLTALLKSGKEGGVSILL